MRTYCSPSFVKYCAPYVPLLQASLSAGSEFVWSLPVVPGCTLELTLAQFWSSLGSSSLTAAVCFHGVTVDGASGAGEPGVGLTLDGSAGTRRFVVRGLMGGGGAAAWAGRRKDSRLLLTRMIAMPSTL